LVIDASFDEHHHEKETKSFASQIQMSSGQNRKSLKPFKFWITSYGGQLEQQLNKHNGLHNWKIQLDSKHFTDIFEKEKLIYLSSESSEVMTE